MTWLTRAECRDDDPGLYEVDYYGNADPTALAVCGQCPVSNECLADAMKHEGTWRQDKRATVRGGLTPRQRARLAGVPS